MRLRLGWLHALAIGLFLPAAAAQADVRLQEIANGDHRSGENRARNDYRHPVETLSFFGLKDDMTVVELWPGGGWYTEILAPYLREKGHFIAAGFDQDVKDGYYARGTAALAAKLAARPDLYDRVTVSELAPPHKATIAPAGSADLVLTFRNLHNWMGQGQAEAVLAAAFRALKPGGVLGLVEHRGDPAKPQDPAAKSGYVTEAHAIALAEQAGFRLAARSEVNANPKDTKDYPKGVWTLPPNLALGEEDRDRFQAIGESDRMTLKFIKPAE